MFAPDQDVDIVTSQSESESERDRAAAVRVPDSDDDDSRPLHEIVVPPFSSEDDMKDVEIISFNGDKQKKKKKKKKRRQGPVIGPVFETFDIGLPPGEYIDITPLEPLPKYGRIEMGVMKKVLRPGKGPAPKVKEKARWCVLKKFVLISYLFIYFFLWKVWNHHSSRASSTGISAVRQAHLHGHDQDVFGA